MEIPKNVKLYEDPRTISWMDQEGIICSVSRKGPDPTPEEQRAELLKTRERFGEGKFCFLVDITNGNTTTSRELREVLGEELPKVVKAMAMITTSALSRMAANLFFGLKPPSYPTRMFSSEKEAREWLRQYL